MLTVAVHLAVLLATLTSSAASECDEAGPRIDCGFFGITQEDCESKGCCWHPVTKSQGRAHIDLPWCYFSNGGIGAYELLDLAKTGSNDGYEGDLVLRDAVFEAAGADVEQLKLKIDYYAQDVLRVQILDANSSRWQVPEWPFPIQTNRQGASPDTSHFSVDLEEKPFALKVTGKEGGQHIFDTSGFRLVYKDQYLEWTTSVPGTASIYGLGERTTSDGLRLQKNGLPRALWTRDWGAANPDANLYGHHPFYLQLNEDGSSHGVLLFNSNGMDVVISKGSISFRVIGGVLDFFFFVGPSPMSVMEQLTRVIGRPAMQPFWSLGFHQSRWGYKSAEELKFVVTKYAEARIPLETIWSDIDYMEGYRVFTLDEANFNDELMTKFLDWLHSNGQHWVPIMDPGIKIDDNYTVYKQALEEDVFVKDVTGEPYYGVVWPGPVHFPSFLHPAGRNFWQRQIADFHRRVPFDGMWIDMNEASNFCTGEVCRLPATNFGENKELFFENDCPLKCFSQSEIQHLMEAYSDNSSCPLDAQLLMPTPEAAEKLQEYLSSGRAFKTSPYKISNSNNLSPLGTNALGVSVEHGGGEVEYNVHSLYGFMEAVATHAALKNVTGKRPFVLTRSSFPGSGGYAAHWTGDNAATWDNMYWSILGVINAGMMGIPMAGADICGFNGQPDEELCARWISLGAFYPFARNHHSINAGTQELYKWESVSASSRKALSMRYALLAYMYTGLRQAAARGCPLIRPLFMNYPSDPNTYAIDRQFMLGDGILVTPVLEKSADSVKGYFPAGTWYSMWDESPIESPPSGTFVMLPAPLGDIPLHVAGGHVIPMQPPMMTTRDLRTSPFILLVTMPALSSMLSPAVASVAASRRLLEAGGAARGAQRCAGADLPQLCGQNTEVQMTACGQLYFDGGDDIEVNESTGSSLTVMVKVMQHPDGVHQYGELMAIFGSTASFAQDASDCGDLVWPDLHTITILGIGNSTIKSAVVEQVVVGGGLAEDGTPLLNVVSTRKLHKGRVLYNSYRQELHFPNINHRLSCPKGLRVRWNATLLEVQDS